MCSSDLFGESFNGFSSAIDITGEKVTNDGPVFAFFAILAIGAGITFLAARRVLALAIVVLVFEVFALFAALADIGDMSDLKDLGGSDVTTGAGLYVVLIGTLVAVAGNIVAIAKRRR